MLQAYYKIKRRLGQILLPISVVFLSDAARANIDAIGQPDDIPTQHMVMAGMPGGQGIIQTGGGSQAKKSAQKTVLPMKDREPSCDAAQPEGGRHDGLGEPDASGPARAAGALGRPGPSAQARDVHPNGGHSQSRQP